MQIVSEPQKIQNLCQIWQNKGESISLVPTMGCLHAGHLSLVKKAQSLAGHVVVSIFVNPLQFGDTSDFLKYPSTLDEDTHKLEDLGVDLVFAPEARSFYPEGEREVELIELGGITTILEGEQRPGHFAGVATVVKRLFDLIQPSSAIFGEKDFQQLMMIKQLVETFSLDIEIIGMPIFREVDGLAMSSRNLGLSADHRLKAPEIYRQLESIKVALDRGKTGLSELEANAYKNLVAAGFAPEYIVIREISTLLPPKNNQESMVILAAAKLGDIRLIDNLRV